MLTNGTRYSMPQPKVKLLGGLLLDHMRWVITSHGDWAWAVLGRSIAAAGSHRAEASFNIAALKALGRALPAASRQAEMDEFVATLQQQRSSPPGQLDTLVGNRQYYNSDANVHRRPRWMVVTRLRSRRTVAARCINGQCLQAQHVADGSLQLYLAQGSNRYENMFAVWDWHSLPGITCLRDSPFFDCDPHKSEAIGYVRAFQPCSCMYVLGCVFVQLLFVIGVS